MQKYTCIDQIIIEYMGSSSNLRELIIYTFIFCRAVITFVRENPNCPMMFCEGIIVVNIPTML